MRGGILVAVVLVGCDAGRSVTLDSAVDAGPDSLVCPAGKTKCSGACVDTSQDTDHCGACDNACDTSAGFLCTSGACVCVGVMTECSGVCVDVSTDNGNCGACGAGCLPFEWCENGMCVHNDCGPPPLMCCGGAVIDPRSDPNNCGGCGITCDVANGFACVSGACVCAVSSSTDCGGTCVNLQNDANNCGSCGNSCGTQWCNGQSVQMSCSFGVCGGPCPTGQTMCCGSCVDTQADSKNCGTCGCECPAGHVCDSATCTTGCPSGQIPCTTGAVVPAPGCPGGQLPVEACVNPQSDDNNCGACGTTCASGQICVNGTCT